MEGAFLNASNVKYGTTDSPNLSGVTDMSRMFYGANNFNGDLSGWKTSGVTDMSGMFTGVVLFTSDLSGWDTASVTNMSGMFSNAFSFTGDLSGWDTASVTDMSWMFHHAISFNGDISGWDTAGVTDMSGMFWSARAFNGDISGWDTASVTDMSGMFGATRAFNGDISEWDVSKVTDMTNMFYQASAFSQNLGPWYITLNDTSVGGDGSYAAAITAQNAELREHNATYGLAGADEYPDNANFTISGGVLSLNEGAPERDSYTVGITATGSLFGQDNARAFEIAGQSNSPPLTPTPTPTLPPPTPNSMPVADAGVNQTVSEGATVQLNGSNSSDPDGSVVSYVWTAPVGITLDNATIADPPFIAPAVTSDTDYMFMLTVMDDDGATTTTEVFVTVRGSAPPPIPVTTLQEPPPPVQKICR